MLYYILFIYYFCVFAKLALSVVTSSRNILIQSSVYTAGSRPSQPARRSFHKWQTFAQPHPP